MTDYALDELNLLIVDDSKHMRTLVRTIVNSLGILEVYEAENGEQAYKVLEDFPVDIIIVDWNMSPMDGIEFTRQVRTSDDSPNAYVPIIMLTGHTQMKRVEIAGDAGVNKFLAKPVSAKKIYQRIHEILEKPRQYIRTPNYFGPNRRRKNDPEYRGEERRKQSGR